MAGKGYIKTENSQMASNIAVFTSTYHTKQLNPWQPNSSANCVVKYSRLSVCQRERETFTDHLNTCVCLTSHSRNKPQQKQPGQPSVPVYLPELLVNVYSYSLMENSVSYYCVHGFSQFQSQYCVHRFSYILMYWLFTTVKLAICVPQVSCQ